MTKAPTKLIRWPVRGTLSKQEKKDYIAAVKCLQSKPPKTPAAVAPGAKTRFDDFVAVHINQTLEIHYTGNFLSWHRYYTWLYEKALQEDCGYKGTQPVSLFLSIVLVHPLEQPLTFFSTGTGAFLLSPAWITRPSSMEVTHPCQATETTSQAATPFSTPANWCPPLSYLPELGVGV